MQQAQLGGDLGEELAGDYGAAPSGATWPSNATSPA